MWRIVQSQRIEKLFQALLRDLQEPLDDPMTPEVVVVQDMGTARWLTHQLARHQGIAAHVQFLVPAALVDLVYRAWLGEDESAAKHEDSWSCLDLTWRIFKLLRTYNLDPEFQELRHYLDADPSGLKRYQLAAQVARAFDRYLVYRQDILRSWETGEDSDWQAHLWRALVHENPVPHQAQRHLQFLKAVGNGSGPLRPERLPSRVSLFGVALIAPVHLEVLDVLASKVDVRLYFMNPSREYWGDIPALRADPVGKDLSWHQENGCRHGIGINPLMMSWALSGCFLFRHIQDIQGNDEDFLEDFEPTTLLEAVQHDIYNFRDRRTPNPEERLPALDLNSLQIHACHSPMREIQVLHDHLAHLLETLPGLTPEDVVVMAPDINVYAPYVEAVFGTRDNPRLPWNISDRKSVEEDPVLQRILDLLRLPHWRCTASDILSLLEIPSIATRFGFDEKGLDRVRSWVLEAGVRWALDAAMREEMGLPRDTSHTWRMGLDRLLAGYALPPQELFWGDVLAYPDVEASDAPWLGGLHDLLDAIRTWRRILQIPKSPQEWQLHGNALLDAFFHPDAQESLDRFRQALDTFASAAHKADCSEPLSVEVVRPHLESLLAESPNIRRFLTGGITFCNLVPLRSIPFRVMCILGMNDTDFPRTERLPEFDLLARSPRPGDRRRRFEDRYLFLEALMSARDVFYVSYIGRDIRDNTLKAPSVVVSELLDYVEQSYRAENGSLVDHIVRFHSLQPFSPRLYDGSSPQHFSYDTLWLHAVQAREQSDVPPFVDKEFSLPVLSVKEVALEDLIRFFDNPSAWFLEKRLGLAVSRKAETLEDEEPFIVDGLVGYWMNVEILEGLLRKESPEALRQRLKGRGWLPHGVAGDLCFQEKYEAMHEMARKVLEHRGTSPRVVEVDIPIGDIRVRGWLPNVTERGRLVYRPASIKAKDRLRLWIQHLALCAARPSGVALESLHIGMGNREFLRFNPVENPEKYLEDLVDLWFQGQQRPLPFFPESSWAYAKESNGAPVLVPPARLCGKTWKDEYYERGDAYDVAVQMAFRGLEPLDEAFAQVAWKVFGPIVL
ncbi:MAG: exodeoxyribonuclease V subunit gamma [Desulfosoma sp.]